MDVEIILHQHRFWPCREVATDVLILHCPAGVDPYVAAVGPAQSGNAKGDPGGGAPPLTPLIAPDPA